MFLDGEDFKSVWQLSHNWAGEDPNITDVNAISPKLKTAIHRLMHAMAIHEISARSSKRLIFEDNSLWTFITDFIHYLKFYRCLRKDKFNKDYLDNLYVKRYEVIRWCINVALIDPPPCWATKRLPYESISTKETKNYRPADENEDRIRCQSIASALWELDAAIHPLHIVQSTIIQRLGNGRNYSEETIKGWIKSVDPQKDRKKGPPPNQSTYRIDLIKDPQLKNKQRN